MVAMTKSDKQSDKNLLKQSGLAVADTTVATADTLLSTFTFGIPGLTLAWELSKRLYGNAMQLRQKRVLEWVQAIIDNPAAFNESIVSSQEFQDGFVVALEDYLKLRDFLKRRIAVKVFKEFASSDDKVEFPLERFNDTLKKVSPASLRTLAFIKNEVLPVMEREPDATQFSKYIDANKLSSIGDQLNELEFLGLAMQVSGYPNGLAFSSGGMITGWALTNFAKEFIEFVEDDTELGNNSLLQGGGQ